MIKLYICEICDHRSHNWKEIKECEDQGKNPLFSEGQSAVLAYGPATEKRPIVMVGKVISYTERTHLPVYGIEVSSEYPELRRTLFSAPESWLKPVPSVS